ncbi:ABC transporter permease [Salipiger sp. P9]|uniref:ABC transporter permease n=1 Tax=Salipiger pentaromativorans TaxID=2943193 RepID=UPI0021587744|nr:ABC transporter permease [Salipiger pentaromativorans]MCR8550909.1 ABC transporter permease [Salipiger pentaromativorans]
MTVKNFAPPIKPDLPTNRRFASFRAIGALMLREMATSYGRSPGGYIWAILEPVAGVMVLTVVFSAFMRAPSLGISFPMFYSTGMMPFIMFSSLQGKVAGALNYSRPLLAYPTVTFVDAILARLILDVITKLLVGYIVLGGIMIVLETRTTPDLPIILQSYALMIMLGLGIGTLNCYLFSRFPLYHKGWSIVTRPLFIISGVIFLFDDVPLPFRDYLWYNPLVHPIGLMRRGFYPTYDAPYVSLLYPSLVAIISLTLGLMLLRRYHRDLLSR